MSPKDRLGLVSGHLSTNPPAAARPPSYRERSHYKHFTPIETRFSDNDMYGHINNMYYFQFMCNVVNGYLANECKVDFADPSNTRYVIAEMTARFHAQTAYPSEIEGGLVVTKIGRSSVHYRVGLFDKSSGQDLACTVGELVHVFVDPLTRRPVSAIPENIDKRYRTLMV